MLTQGKRSMDIHHYCYYFFYYLCYFKTSVKMNSLTTLYFLFRTVYPNPSQFFLLGFFTLHYAFVQPLVYLESWRETNSINILPLANNFMWKRRPTKGSLKAQLAGVWALLYHVWSQASHFLLWRGRHLRHKISPQNCRLSGH